MLPLITALILSLTQQPAPVVAPEVDPAIRAVVERFFQTQQAEDVEAYLALWSAQSRPRPDQLKFIFDSGDDEFLDLAITRAMASGDSARVRVAVTRVRTDAQAKRPDGKPRVFNTRLRLALSLAREAGEWKIVREGAPADELARALIQTTDAEERKRILESEPDLLNSRLVEAIARQADTFVQLSQFKPAQAIYERALEVAQAIGDKKAEGQAIQNIANSLYFQRDFEGALSLYDRRLALEREIDNKEGMASALLGIATIRYSNHEYGAALEMYREALAIQETLDDNLMISTTLISTGNVLYLQGDYEAAIADYRRAEDLKRKYLDLGGAATALEGLGRVYSAQGNYAAALTAFAGVLEERRKRNDVPRQATVLHGIGEIHFRLGNTDQARTTFEESRKLFEAAKNIGGAGRVLQGTALNELVAGRFPAGEKAYAESIALCTTATDAECIARAQVGLAFALAAQEKYDEAIAWYSKSILSFIELKMKDAETRARIGSADALLGKGDAKAAFDEAVKARHTAIAMESDDLLWRALVGEARAERKLDRPAEALGAAKAAMLAVQRMAAAALDRPGHAVSRDTTAAFTTLALLQAEAGDGAGAFTTAEQMRAHALRAWLAPHEREISRGMTDAERDEERKLATELSTLIVRRDRQKELPNPDAAEIEKLELAIADVARRRRAAQESLFGRLPDLRTWRGLGPAATMEDLGPVVGAPGSLLLQFLVDDRDLVILAGAAGGPGVRPTSDPTRTLPPGVRPTSDPTRTLPRGVRPTSDPAGTGVRPTSDPSLLAVTAAVVPIGRQELAERIGRAMDGKALADPAAWRKASADLWALLPSPILDALKAATSIVIVPDDVLWRVPFEAMPVGEKYLADQASVSYATSLGAITLPPALPGVERRAPVLVVHSPELPASVVETLKTTAPTWTLRTPESAAAEVVRIAGEGVEPAPVVLTGGTAVASAFRRNSRPFSALHLAAPFRVNSASPLFSPVLLAQEPSLDKEGTEPDPELTARDVFELEPLAPVVMFSDPAALSRRDAAASLAPIVWAWASSGASTVILRRWSGEEAAASDVIAEYYEQLSAGKCPAEALASARAMVRSHPGGRAPAKWAGWLTLEARTRTCR